MALLTVLTMLISVFLIPPLGIRAAEETDIPSDADLIRWGMALAAEMMGTAAETDVGEDLSPMLDTFKSIDFAEPYNAFIAELSKEDAQAAAKTVGADALQEIAPALASFINLQFGSYGARYDAVVSELTAMGEYTRSDLPFTLILLPYREHILIACLDGPVLTASFIISDEMTSRHLDEDLIRKDAGDLNVKGITIRSYTPDDLDILFLDPGENEEEEETDETDGPFYIPWSDTSGSASLIGNTASRSVECMDALFPVMAKSGRIPLTLCANTLSRFMNANKNCGLDAAIKVSEDYLPLFEERDREDGDITARFFDIASNLLDEQIEGNEVPDKEYTDLQIDPDATYLFVVEKIWPDGNTLTGFDPFLESGLPAENIPEDPEDADYIIRTVVTWDGDTYVSGNHTVYYSYMHTVLYDADSGEAVMDLGTSVHALNGFMMVTGNTTYMSPSRDLIWKQVEPLFYPDRH